MNYSSHIKRSFSLALAVTLVVSFFAFLPSASAAAELDFNPAPADKYVVGTGDYSVYTVLQGYEADTEVNFWVGKKGELLNLIETHTFTDNGSYKFVWDGKIKGVDPEPGDYGVQILGKGIALNHSFAVLPKPVLSFDQAPADTYTLGDEYEVTVKLENYVDDANIDFSILGPEGDQDAVWQMVGSHTYTGNGTHTFVWDGKYQNLNVEPGKYSIGFGGTYGDDFKPLESISDTLVIKPEPVDPNPVTQCAEYKDVLATDQDCAAIEYAKKIGAMTGHDNGTFGKNEILQRDHIAKISLVAFNLFDENKNYCGGKNPFPDVTVAQWSFQYVCRGVELAMITGYKDGPNEGKFVPAGAVNRAELLALTLRNVNDKMPSNDTPSYDDVPLGQWFTGYAAYSKDHSLFTGKNLFPTQEVERVEVARVLYKLNQQGLL